MNSFLVEQALRLAVTAHEGQVRKSDGSPYIVHPVMVARILDRAGCDETAVAAGYVHDVLEDTTVTETVLRKTLGDTVTDIVCAVTEDKTLPWEARKLQYIKQVVTSGEAAMAVSVADKIHNAESLLRAHATYGREVWSVFNRGKAQKVWFEKALYEALVPKYTNPLLARYETLISELEALAE